MANLRIQLTVGIPVNAIPMDVRLHTIVALAMSWLESTNVLANRMVLGRQKSCQLVSVSNFELTHINNGSFKAALGLKSEQKFCANRMTKHSLRLNFVQN